MTRTFGSDNPIAWVQVRLKGGLRNLLSTTATYSAVVILAMLGTIQLFEENPTTMYSRWMVGMLALQSAVLLLLGSARVSGAIKLDLTSGIIESNRLMPIAPMQAVIGYIFGSVAQAMCLAGANLVIGGFAAVQAGISPGYWFGANALILTFAMFIWTIIASSAFHQKNVMGFLFFAPAIPMIGQSGALGLVPGIMLLLTPLLGGSIFDISATLGGLRDIYILSIAAQMVVGSLCFVAACRKYRRSDVIGFTPLLGLLLLATWVAVSCFGTMWWEDLKPSYIYRQSLNPGSQFLTAVLIGMILALIPVWSAAEQTAVWVGRKQMKDPALHRRPVRDELVVIIATLVLLPLAAGAQVLILGQYPRLLPFALITLTIFLHLISMSALRRMLRFYIVKLNGIQFMTLGVLWIGPLLVDLGRHQLIDDPKAPILTELSCVSPAGTIVALMTGREGEVTAGLMIQVLLAALAVFSYHRTHPLRHRGLSGGALKEI
jgi:hypothetical protein